MFVETPILNEFAVDVHTGLTKKGQKELPSKYLYDALGSRLFDAITALPEYGLTRAEERILKRHAPEIVERLPSSLIVAELGSGTGGKTRLLLELLGSRHATSYFPIEISRTALAMCKKELGDIEAIHVVGMEKEYLDGLREVATRRQDGESLLVLFLGSTIGNFDGPADAKFLSEIRQMLQPGDAMLLGTDLEKSISRLIDAYDDPLGVTAAFNLNLLARMNRELEANFDLSRFEHEARFNYQTRSMEMHIRALEKQDVVIPKAGFFVTLEEGETIWTESSHKYSLAEVSSLAAHSEFRCEGQWVDTGWPFAETLLIAS